MCREHTVTAEVSLDCALRGVHVRLISPGLTGIHPCLFISSHVFITRPSTIPPPTVYPFIYSSIHARTSSIHPSIHTFCLFTIHPPSTFIRPPSDYYHPSVHYRPPTIHLSINPSVHPPFSHPSPTHPPFRSLFHPSAGPSTHPSIHHPGPMGPCIPPFLHSSAHRPFSYHSFIFSFTGSSRNLP